MQIATLQKTMNDIITVLTPKRQIEGQTLKSDVNVPREVLIAGENAKMADMEAARKMLDETDGKMEKAEQLYVKYLRENKEINYTKRDELPF